MNNLLVEYIHDKNKRRNKRGVIVAKKTAHGFILGWALCRKGDNFDKQFGLNIAVARADSDSKVKIPHSLQNAAIHMVDRAKRYFKTN